MLTATTLLCVLCCLFLLPSVSTAARQPPSTHHPRHTGAADQSSSRPNARDACNGQDWGTSGQFDLYVLAESWGAEYCHSRLSLPGCAQPTEWERSNLTLHGLWPQYAQETDGHPYPQCCTSQYGQELTEDAVQPYLAELQQYWPNEEAPSGTPLTSTLWYHEWAVHGTCSGIAQADFLQLALSLTQSLPTPSIISDNVGGSVQLSAIEAAYNNGVACGTTSCMVWVQCTGQYLSEIHTCWDRDGTQIECPTLVVSEANRCKSGAVKISAFTGSASGSARDEL